MFQSISRLLDKTGVAGTLLASMGCAACFPALGALASTLGLGFLAQFEGVFINSLLPVFVLIVLVTAVLSFLSHKVWLRLIAAITGPIMILLTLYPLWAYDWSTYLFYFGLLLMFSVSLWDVLYPPKKLCNNRMRKSML